MNKQILLFLLTIILMACHANTNDNVVNKANEDRQPVVSGTFYPENAKELNENISTLFDQIKNIEKDKSIKALIVPHAGYAYSGEVAAYGYSSLDLSARFDNVFIIASSHRVSFNGASIYNKGDYITPLGKIKVNTTLANKIIGENTVFSYKSEAHSNEHSIEVQLPFLQFIYGDHLQIVPVVIGTFDQDKVILITKALEPYFAENNLFVISSDFSHYPDYDDAVKYDHETMQAILTNSTEKFIKVLDEHDKRNIPNLVTSACGSTSILTLMHLTEGSAGYHYKHIFYKNSGEYLNKNKSRVVGYHAIKVTSTKDNTTKNEKMETSEEFEISLENQKKLLNIARTTIENYIKKGEIIDIDIKDITQEISLQNGAFVTLHKNGDLRGCIGRFTTTDPLYQTVQKMAISAATEDYRFEKVTADELMSIDIEISVLSPLKKIESIDEILLGKHGIYIISGYNKGTFLPQVATETGWTKEEFLGHCARDKARIGWYGWKEAEIYIYEAFVFGEKNRND